MNIYQLRSLFLLPVALLVLISFTGCEQKKTESEQPAQTTDTTTKPTQEEPKLADVKGAYKGTFDNKAATLNITEQNENSFKGNLKINYRNPLNQDVEGEFDSKTMEFNMEDTKAGKFQGTYKGKFNEDFSTLSGTFTLNSKGGSYSFNLKKK